MRTESVLVTFSLMCNVNICIWLFNSGLPAMAVLLFFFHHHFIIIIKKNFFSGRTGRERGPEIDFQHLNIIGFLVFLIVTSVFNYSLLFYFNILCCALLFILTLKWLNNTLSYECSHYKCIIRVNIFHILNYLNILRNHWGSVGILEGISSANPAL